MSFQKLQWERKFMLRVTLIQNMLKVCTSELISFSSLF